MSKKSRREKKRDRHRQEIMDAAEMLFLSQGYEKTTIKEIADKALYAKGTIYNYFESKEELYLSIGTKAYDLIIEYTKEFVEKEEIGVNQLMAVGYAYYEFTKDYPAYATIFHDISEKLPKIAKKKETELIKMEKEYLEQSHRYRDVFIEVIQNAVKKNAIRSDVSPIMIGITLASLTSGLIKELNHREEALNNLHLEKSEIVDFVFNMIVEGLKPRKN
jgi:AcrR family transcriptional regulator